MRVGGLDFGRFADHSVLATLHSEGEGWVVDAVRQLPLGLPAAAQLRQLQPYLDRLDRLAVDAGGSGQSLPDHIRGPASIVPIVITGGTGKGKLTKGRVTVGKTALIGGLMQQIYRRELRVDPSAPGRDLLLAEMKAFQYQPDGRFRKMEAASGQHDDCVISVALAVFVARRSHSNAASAETRSPSFNSYGKLVHIGDPGATRSE